MIRHLFPSRVEILRMQAIMANGAPTIDWVKVDDIIGRRGGAPGELMCRLDLNFLRPGKDALPPLVAGRAADRIGVMFTEATDKLAAGDRIRCIDGPVTGTFEIRNNPDPAVAYSRLHHFEVQIIEVAQSVAQPMRVHVDGQ